MSLRASWHLPDLSPVDEGDPFAAPIEDVAVPIRLDGPTARLGVELVDLVKREKRLRDLGVSCPIRDLPETSCSACPVVGRYPELCPIGRRQETLLTELAVHEVNAHGQ